MARSLSNPDPDPDSDARRSSVKPRALFGALNIVLFVAAVWAVYTWAPAAANKALFVKIAGGGVILAMWLTNRSTAWLFERFGRWVLVGLVVAWTALAGWFLLGL